MANDDVITFPLTGWATATLPDQSEMLEVRFITSPFERVKDSQSLRLSMTAAQASELGEALRRMATAAVARHDPPDDKPH